MRFLESIIQRSFEEIALGCVGIVEIFPIVHIKKTQGGFIDSVRRAAKEAGERGIMILCIHADADDISDSRAFDNKINPAFAAVWQHENSGLCKNLVAVVPVQMSEAWMLSDKALLKYEIGTDKTDSELGLDRYPEDYSDPKNTIAEAINIAESDLTRRKRGKLKVTDLYSIIGQKVSLVKLDALPSYSKFNNAVREAFKKMNLLHE